MLCCRYQRLILMASRLNVRSSNQGISAAKKPRTMKMSTETVSPMKEEFSKHANYLNELNDKRERIVKASRDVTLNSKKVIFQVHRLNKDNKDEVLNKAENDLTSVTSQYMLRLVNELKGTDFWKLRRAYTFAIQEYVEAATFFEFCKTGSLLNLEEINDTLRPLSNDYEEPLQINTLDYLLGLADLTGELMRLAIGRISDGEVEYAEKICSFVRDIYRELVLLAPLMDDNVEMKKKMDVMLQSVVKIENGSKNLSAIIFKTTALVHKEDLLLPLALLFACFGVRVRGSEYIPMLGSSDHNYSFIGVPDFD